MCVCVIYCGKIHIPREPFVNAANKPSPLAPLLHRFKDHLDAPVPGRRGALQLRTPIPSPHLAAQPPPPPPGLGAPSVCLPFFLGCGKDGSRSRFCTLPV